MRTRIRLRVAQTARYFRRGKLAFDRWEALLTPEAARTFAMLPPGDQRHAIAVASWLAEHGASRDLVTAGLLHDIGKAGPGIILRLPDRIAKVILARIAPKSLAAIAAWPHPRWPFAGLWVLSRHAAVGGKLVRQWGYPERVAWIVEHHEDHQVTDPELAMLMAIDDGRSLPPVPHGLAHG